MPVYRGEQGLVEAERWFGTNTAHIFSWVRRTDTARIRWYPAITKDTGDNLPPWSLISEHIVIEDFAGMITVRHNEWIVRDDAGHYEVYAHKAFWEKFKLATPIEASSKIVEDETGAYSVQPPVGPAPI